MPTGSSLASWVSGNGALFLIRTHSTAQICRSFSSGNQSEHPINTPQDVGQLSVTLCVWSRSMTLLLERRVMDSTWPKVSFSEIAIAIRHSKKQNLVTPWHSWVAGTDHHNYCEMACFNDTLLGTFKLIWIHRNLCCPNSRKVLRNMRSVILWGWRLLHSVIRDVHPWVVIDSI